jgi:Chaperone of endosialidase
LALDSNKQLISTTTIGTNLLTGTLATINNTAIAAGSSATITAASSTLFTDRNSWTGHNIFSSFFATTASTTNATTTNFHITSLASALLATDQNGRVVATTSIYAASSTLLANANSWTGLNQFADASTTLLSGTTAWFTTFVGSVTGNASTASALQTARNINNVSFDGTSDITITAASSTLLSNSNTWSGLNVFANSTSTLASVGTLWQTSSATSTFTGGLDFTRFNLTATSTGSQGINLTGGCFAINGTCVGGGSGGVGSGTQGQFAFYNVAGTSLSATSTLTLLQSGLLGIGTSTPWGKLSITATDNASTPQFVVASSSAVSLLVTNTGNVGIGTTSPATTFSVGGNGYFTGGLGVGKVNTTANTVDLASGGAFKIAGTSVLTGTTLGSGVTASSLTSVGTLSSLTTTGDVSAGGHLYGGNTLELSAVTNSTGIGNYWICLASGSTKSYQFSYAASTCNPSDARLKTSVADLPSADGLDAIMQLRPVSFRWRGAALDAAQGPQIGFLAQDVQTIFPSLVSSSTASTTITLADGSTETVEHPLSLNYQGLVVPLVKAVQEVALIAGAFKTNLIAWFADAANGIANIISDTLTARERLCVGDTCVTPEQFKAMAAAANQSASSGSASPPASASQSSPPTSAEVEPPTLAISGENPARIHVGDTYADLGARITAPDADKNLGIKTYLNGRLVSDILLDTSAAATSTIDYVATGHSGLAATSTRTVFVDPADVPPLAPDTVATTALPIIPSDGATSTATTTAL